MEIRNKPKEIEREEYSKPLVPLRATNSSGFHTTVISP